MQNHTLDFFSLLSNSPDQVVGSNISSHLLADNSDEYEYEEEEEEESEQEQQQHQGERGGTGKGGGSRREGEGMMKHVVIRISAKDMHTMEQIAWATHVSIPEAWEMYTACDRDLDMTIANLISNADEEEGE